MRLLWYGARRGLPLAVCLCIWEREWGGDGTGAVKWVRISGIFRRFAEGRDVCHEVFCTIERKRRSYGWVESYVNYVMYKAWEMRTRVN